MIYQRNHTRPSMRRCSDVSFGSHIRRDVADNAETPSQRRNWYVGEMDIYETSLRRLIDTYIRLTNLRRCDDVQINTEEILTNLTRRKDVTTGI